MRSQLCSLAAVAGVIGLSSPAAAQGAPWCAAYRNGSNNCGFYTYDQCMASVSGIGGYCNRNYIDGPPDKPAARKERVTEPKPKRKEEKERAAPAQKSVSPPAAVQPAPPPAAAVPPQPTPPPAAAQPAPPPAAQQPASTAQQQASFGSARALILSGKYEAGITAMKALGYDDHPDVAGSIGFSYAKLGSLNEARAWYAKALAADPNHVATLSNSGALYVAQGDLAKARADLDRIKAACGAAGCREYRELESLIAAKGR
jgi:tetratricopeptide (TPR) repeat protein